MNKPASTNVPAADPYREQAPWNFLFIIIYLLLIAAGTAWFQISGSALRSIPIFDFVTLTLAIFRLTHLLVYDHITHFIRHYFNQFPGGPGKTLANLLDCEWCAGIWVAALILFLYLLAPWTRFPILAVALAGAGTFINITAKRVMRS